MDFLGNPDPGSIDRVASVLTRVHGGLTSTEGGLNGGVSRLVGGGWHGSAAAAFQGHWATQGTSINALAGAATNMASILTGLASELRHAQAVARQAEGLAQSHGMTIGADGSVRPVVTGKPPTPAEVQALGQVQGLVNQAKGVANAARSRASGALSCIAVPQVQPGVTPQAAALWAQVSMPGHPGSPPNLGGDLWKALEHNAIPPGLGAVGNGFWGFGRGLTVFGKIASWMTTVQLGRFAPRDALGRFVSPGDLSWWETALKSTDGKNWIARPYLADTRAFWSTAGKWTGRAGGVLAIGLSGFSQWMQDSGNRGLDTGARVGRAAYRGLVAGGAAWGGAIAGAEVGGAIGTAVGGPVGTVIGGLIGGVVGGVAASGVANFVVDHTVNWVGHATDTVVHDVGHVGGAFIHDVGDAGSHAIHFIESLNPF